MRCKSCGKVNRNSVNNRKCWKLWCLCHRCAVYLHKEEYPKNQVARWLRV